MIDTILKDRDLRGNSSNWANWMSKLTLRRVYVSIQRNIYDRFFKG